jgi:1-phosphatidylinositol-3-phosphate 5-kinase
MSLSHGCNAAPCSVLTVTHALRNLHLQVKRLPDVGSPADSCVVKGVVAKKNVAHRRMRADVDDPAVLLLSGALEYQRVANKLSSFDTLLDQEREHLRLAVARIAACK